MAPRQSNETAQPARRNEGGAATRLRILDAAEHLFAENGVDGTSLRSIMAAAGVSISQINYHFGTKEALLRAIFERRAVDVGVGEYFLDPIDGHTRKFRWKKPDPHPSL